MKLQPLLFAVALATGAAFAQAPQGGAKPADTQAGNTTSPSAEAAAPAKSHKKAKHASTHHNANAKQHEHVASAKHHGEHHAMERHHGTREMGSGPSVDLNSSSRQTRMDQAYADWQGRQH